MIAGNILPSEFPQRRVEITNVNHVAGSIIDLNAIPDAERLADKNVDPSDETLHWRLHGQANDDRSNAQCSKRSVPIYKDYRDGNEQDYESNEQMFDSPERETDSSVFDSTQRINRNRFCNRKDDDNDRGAAQNSMCKIELRRRKRHELRAEKKIKSGESNQQKRMRDKPELVSSTRLDLFAGSVFACGSSQLFADFRFFGNLLCDLGHQL